MRFKQTIKRIAALSTGASMVGATMFGAMAANLADYPKQYIKDGKFTGVLVVGDKAAAEDVIGVSDIAVSLQAAAVKPAGSAGSSVAASGGEAWKVGTSTKILELGENLDSGTNRETIASIVSNSFIDDTELESTLASGVVSNGQGDAPYEQRLYFEDSTTGYVFYTEDDEDVTADFLYFANAKQIARYELEFTTSLESDVDDSTGSASTTGTYLTDLEDSSITMFGKEFTIVQARRQTTSGGGVKLVLMGGAVRDSLVLGDTKTYTIDSKDFEVTLDFVDTNSAKFTINGETTRDMVDGDTDKLSDGTTIGISEILFQDFAGGVHSAEFFLGAQKIEMKDDNIENGNTASNYEVKISDETIDGAAVRIEGQDDNSTFKLDKIVVNMTADDDYFIPAGGKLSENPQLDEPELLFTKAWDVEYQGLTSETTQDIRIVSKGSDDYELEFVDGRGNKASVPIAYTSGTTVLKMGDTDDDLRIFEFNTTGSVITKDDYFIVTDENDDAGERQSFALRYRGSDKLADDNPIIKFDDLGSGDRVERSLSAGTATAYTQVNHTAPGIAFTTVELAQIKIGGGTFRVYNASSTAVDDFNIFVDLDGSGALEGGAKVSLNTQYGADIQIAGPPAAETLGTINVSVDTPNTDHFDDLNPTAVNVTLSAASGEVDLSEHAVSNLAFQSPQDDDDNSFVYTAYGAFVKLFSPSNDPGEVTVTYPQNQKVPQVFVTGEGVSFESASSGGSTSGAVMMQRIDVGATKLASEVANVKAVNSILVGGPCANAAAAEVMNNPADCAAGFEPGMGVIQMWDVGSGKVAMLVAGYAAEDTRNAAQVVSNYGNYKFKGDKMEVKRVGSSLTVAEPSVMEEEEEAMAEDEE